MDGEAGRRRAWTGCALALLIPTAVVAPCGVLLAESPLGVATRRQKPTAARLLLTHGADASLEDCDGVPLIDARQDPELTDVLLAAGAGPIGTGPTSPVAVAASLGDIELFDTFIEHGVVELSAMDCNVEAARMLLLAGADPARAPGGRTVAEVACPAVAALLP